MRTISVNQTWEEELCCLCGTTWLEPTSCGPPDIQIPVALDQKKERPTCKTVNLISNKSRLYLQRIPRANWITNPAGLHDFNVISTSLYCP